MAEMGRYCKAYLASSLRKFSGWKEDTTDLRGETTYVQGRERVEPKLSLQDDDILYVQEDYVVTHGVFKDEHVVYDDVTDEWKDFCRDELEFELPDGDAPEEARAGQAADSEVTHGVGEASGAGEESKPD
jgi:hypothetical protein